MKFEYDYHKSIINKEKHGVNFEEAKVIWFGDNVIIPALTKDEDRYMIIGKINQNLYSCIFAKRSENIRIISCRKTRDKERKVYYEEIT